MVRRREFLRVLKYFCCEKLFHELGSGNSGGIHEPQRGVSDRRGALMAVPGVQGSHAATMRILHVRYYAYGLQSKHEPDVEVARGLIW